MDGQKGRRPLGALPHSPVGKEAGEAENEHKRALRLGEIHPSDPWPKPTRHATPAFKVFAKEFLTYAATHTKPGTHDFYGFCLDRVLNFSQIADAPIAAITGDLVARYARYRQEVAKASVTTVNADMRTIRRVLRLAAEWGRLEKAPVIHELPAPKGRERVISATEEARYLAVAPPTLRDAAVLAVDTGMRPNDELFRLRWADVDLKASPQALYGVVHVRGGKTGSAKRTVPLTKRSKDTLAERKASADTQSSPYVFPSAGSKGHVRSMQHPHVKAMKRAKLEPFEFYIWRHTFGTRAAMSGMDKYSLAQLMGHSSPAITAKYYVHVTSEHVGAAFDKFRGYHSQMLTDAGTPSGTQAP